MVEKKVTIMKVKNFFEVPKSYINFKKNKKQNNYFEMSYNLKKLHPLMKRHSSYYAELSILAYKQKNFQESLKYINKAIDFDNGINQEIYFKHQFECLIQLNHWNELIDSLKSYLNIHTQDVEAFNMIVEILINQDRIEEAIEYKKRHLEYKKQTKQFIEEDNTNEILSELYYKLGFQQLNQKMWKVAKDSFKLAVFYSEDSKIKKWKIGALHEKFKNWKLAIEEYKSVLEEVSDDAELYYKVGILLRKIKKSDSAIYYLKEALDKDKVLSSWHYSLATCYEDIRDFENAEKWYRSAIERQQTHRPNNYRRLAYIFNKLGKKEEALQAYNEAELFRKPSNMSKTVYDKKIVLDSVKYAISYEYFDIKNEMIFYESMSGGRLMGNPAGIFEYIFEKKQFEEFKHIWVINSFDTIPKKYRDKNNIIFVKRGSDAYLKYISKAKYLIGDSSFKEYVVRKPQQKYLQTTHGIFYKAVGRERKGDNVGVASSTRNLLQATHILAPNDFMVRKQMSSYSIRGIGSDKIAKVGYPRIDITLNEQDNFKAQIKNRIQVDKDKKIVLYAPTWRGGTKKENNFDTEKLVSDLKQLSRLNVNILFRGHTITKKFLKDIKIPENVILPSEDISTNELLNVTDVLISDYSSVFFDFIPTERPIIHYLYDLDKYESERGLNLSEDELPGFIAKTTQELINEVYKGLQQEIPTSKYIKAKERFCPFETGYSGRNVSEWLFNGDESKVERPICEQYIQSDLYLGGMLTNLEELPNLINEINKKIKAGHIVSIVLKKNIEKDTTRMNLIKKLDKKVNLISYAGAFPKTLSELAAIEDLKKDNIYINDYTKKIVNRAYKRELRRLLGDIHFDEIINFESGSSFWKNLKEASY